MKSIRSHILPQGLVSALFNLSLHQNVYIKLSGLLSCSDLSTLKHVFDLCAFRQQRTALTRSDSNVDSAGGTFPKSKQAVELAKSLANFLEPILESFGDERILFGESSVSPSSERTVLMYCDVRLGLVRLVTFSPVCGRYLRYSQQPDALPRLFSEHLRAATSCEVCNVHKLLEIHLIILLCSEFGIELYIAALDQLGLDGPSFDNIFANTAKAAYRLSVAKVESEP